MRKVLLACFLLFILFNSKVHAQEWEELSKTLSVRYNNNMNRHYGTSVAIDGDYAVVGAFNGFNTPGSAYVLHFNGIDWETVARLTSENTSSDKFGSSVSISGDYIVVGAYSSFEQGKYKGVAYVYEKPAAGWKNMTETAKLTASDGESYDYFGFSLSISGDNVALGSYGDDDDGSETGSAYIFTKPLGGWKDMTETAKLTASDGMANDYFGKTICISGEHIIVGAYGDDDNGEKSGSAYIFTKPSGGWEDMKETAKLTASDGAIDNYFGRSISMSNDLVVIGAYGDDDNGVKSGSAYIFEKPAGGWANNTEDAKLIASDGVSNDYFGFSVSASGDYVLVGAYGDDDNGSNSGSAYIFEKPLSGWENMSETSRLLASDGNVSDEFAYTVCISGDQVLVAASNDDDDEYNSGSVYTYEKPVTGWINTTEKSKTHSSDLVSIFDDYGKVSIDGEYAVVGEPSYQNSIGCAYVFYYNGTSWQKQGKLQSFEKRVDDNFGHSVSISGDFIVVSAISSDNNYENNGSVYVFEKPSTGWRNMIETAELSPSSSGNEYWFGSSVDINGDFVTVGARGDGTTFVYEKPVSGWLDMTETAKLTASDGVLSDDFGSSVAIGNGYVAVGAPNNLNNGSVYVYKKPTSGWSNMTETGKLIASDGSTDDYFGSSIDIFNDYIVIGAHGDDDKGVESGSVYLFEKPESGWINGTETLKLNASDGSSNDFFGNHVGISDVHIVVGAYGDDDNGDMSGSVYVFDKLASGWINNTESHKIVASDGSQEKKFGSYVGVSNDWLVVGAPWNNDVATNQGSAYLFIFNNEYYVNDTLICAGDDAVFYVKNDALESKILQWQFLNNDTWEDLALENNDTLKISDVTFDMNEYKYRCIISGAKSDTTGVSILTVNPSFYESETTSVCYGSSYEFPDGDIESNIIEQVIHISNLQTHLGCDSIIETTVDVNSEYALYDTVSICNGSSYTFHDGTIQENITSQVMHSNYLQSVFNCDSIIETTVIINPHYSLKETVSINGGEDYTFPDGTSQTNIVSKVFHTSSMQTVSGCDSIIETIVYPSYLSPTTAFTRYLKYDSGLSTGYGNSVVESADKELLIVGINGQSGDYTNHGTMYIVKTDSLGNKIWSKSLNENYVTYGFQGLNTFDGDFAVLGRTQVVDDGPWHNILVKLSNDGDVLWTKEYPDTINVRCIYETLDDGFIMAGVAGDLIKTDSLGIVEWFREEGESGDNSPYDIIQLSDSSFASANYGGTVTVFNRYGEEQWQYNYNSGGYYVDKFNSIVETNDDCIIAVGESQKTGELNVVKLKLNGELVWQKLFPYQASYNFDYYARQVTITKTREGDFYIGFKSPRMKIIKIDLDGNEIPVEFDYGDGININDVIETQDKGVVCISSLSGGSARWRYFMMMKFDNQGNRCHNYITVQEDTIQQGDLAFFSTDADEVINWSINLDEIPSSNYKDFSIEGLKHKDVVMCESLGCISENWIVMNVQVDDYQFDSTFCEGEDFIYAIFNHEESATYQWQESTSSTWQNIDGETNDTLVIENISVDMSSNKYRCIISSIENDTSDVATLTINPIFNLSESVSVCTGSNYTFPDGTLQSNITSEVIYTSNLETVSGCDSIIETTIEVDPLPVSQYSYETENGEVTFMNNSTYSASYIWDFGDNLSSIEENPVHTYTETGDYNVILDATNDCGTTSSQENIEIVITGLNDLEDVVISVYPNPVDEKLIVDYNERVKIVVYNLVGLKVLESNKTEIDVSALVNGTYIVLIKNSENILLRKIKIVKK